MKKITRIAVTTVFSLFIGIASLTAAENTPSYNKAVYSLPVIVCTAERTPAAAEIAVALPDMSDIGSLVTTTDVLLAEDVYMLPEVVCTAERTLLATEMEAILPDMSNIAALMTTTDGLLAALDEDVYVLPEVVCAAERTTPSTVIAAVLPDMSNIESLMPKTESLLAALDEEVFMPEEFAYFANMAPVPPHRPKRMVSMMRIPNAPRMVPPKPAVGSAVI